MNKSAHNPMDKSRGLTFIQGSGSLDLFTVVMTVYIRLWIVRLSSNRNTGKVTFLYFRQ